MPTRAETLLHTTVDSPIGPLLLLGDGEALHGLHMQKGRKPVRVSASWQRTEEPFADARRQLDEYFAGERRSFDLELAAEGSEFEHRVWRALEDIPYGETESYGQVAERVGAPGAAR
ncbi:MAG: MGMT family protein, partial [Thermoleophilaceae bacterium]